MRVIEFLQRQSPRAVMLLGAALIALVGAVDYVTGAEISVSIFFLVPIAMLAWTVHRKAAVVASFASALVWLLADLATERVYSSTAIPFWNACVRLGFFLTVALTLSSLRATAVMREELSHFIVHDLRTPLSNILAALQLLHSDGLRAEQRSIVDMGMASGNRMASLITSILDLNALENGKLILNRQAAQLETIFAVAVQQVSAFGARSDVRIVSTIDAQAATVFADPEIIARVLVNLLGNAINFEPAGSAIRLSAAPHSAALVAIRVEDHGPGIPREWLGKIFDKFTQVKARQTRVAVGNGLGLNFCRLAVEAHGGRIWVESEIGAGTTVIFTLPRPET